MTGATAAALAATGRATAAAVDPVEFGHVLAGEAVAGMAAELADRLDPAFLTEAGWDRWAGCCRCPPNIRCWAGPCAGSVAARPPLLVGRQAVCAGGA